MLELDYILKERSQRNRKLRLRQGNLAAADGNSAACIARCPDRSHPARTARVRADLPEVRRRHPAPGAPRVTCKTRSIAPRPVSSAGPESDVVAAL